MPRDGGASGKQAPREIPRIEGTGSLAFAVNDRPNDHAALEAGGIARTA